MKVTLDQVKLTAKDLWALTQQDSKWERFELDDGVLIEMVPAGPRHGAVEARLTMLLGVFLEEKPLGMILCGEAGFVLNEERVRAPDIAFISNERLAVSPISDDGFYPGPPDLAIEVRSPNDTRPEILRKISQYFEAGTRLVWEVDPKKRTVTVFRPGAANVVLSEGDTLSGEPVLPGFSLPLAKLFILRT